MPEFSIPPARRRGVSFKFEPNMTFSPALLGKDESTDLFLTCQLGALATSQVRVIRQHCQESNRQLVVLKVLVEDDEDAAGYFDDPGMEESLLTLRPRHLAVEANLVEESGRKRTRVLQKNWQRITHIEVIDLAVEMPLLPWNDREFSDLRAWLMEHPPRDVGVVLSWVTGRFDGSAENLRKVEKILPWVVAVNYSGKAGFDEVCQALDDFGFQGWVFQGSAG